MYLIARSEQDLLAQNFMGMAENLRQMLTDIGDNAAHLYKTASDLGSKNMRKNVPPPAAAKTHRSAVAALPPEAVWRPIQALRRDHDRQFHRWMPHINLVYPFVPPADFITALPLLIDVCRQVQPFPVQLRTLRYFIHASRHATIWLDPEPRAPFMTLQHRLQAVFPAYNDQRRFATGYTPHLSIGQTDSPAMLHRLLPVLQEAWQPLEFILTAVALLRREADHPFYVAHWIPFGNEAPSGLANASGVLPTDA